MKHLSVFLTAALMLAGVASAQTSVPAPLRQKFPGLRAQAKVDTKREAQKGSYFQQTMDISPSMTVEGASTLPHGAMEAIMIIVVVDTGAKAWERRDVYKIQSAETIPVPAVAKATKREFEFKSSQTEFDAFRDNDNVGGLVYKWYIFGLRDAETKQLLHFETNCPLLDKFVSSNPDSRDKRLVYKRGEEFDTNFKR